MKKNSENQKKSKSKKIFYYIGIAIIIIIIILLLLVSCNRGYKVELTVDSELFYKTTIHKGDTLEKIEPPTKEGYIFAGWYLDGKEFDITSPITEDIKLEARWIQSAYTVTFDLDNGQDSIKKEVELDGKVEKPANPTRDGYTFAGWYVDDEVFDFNTKINSNTSITAKWNKITTAQYTVEHYLMGYNGKYINTPTEKEVFIGKIGSTVSPKVKSYKGYTSPSKKTVTIEEDGNTIVKYYYEINTYKLTIEGDNGVIATSGSGTYFYGDKVEVSYKLKQGYSFVGYSEKVNNGQYTMTDNDVTIKISTKANEDTKYVVKHYLMDLDGKNYTLDNTQNLKGTTDTYVTPDVKQYEGFTSPSTKTVTINGDGSTEVSYYYERNSYNLTVTKDEGIDKLEILVKYNDEFIPYETYLKNIGIDSIYYGTTIKLNTTVKDGYSFDGYTTKNIELENSNEVSFVMNTKDITINVNSKVNTYAVTFDLNGENVNFSDSEIVDVNYLDKITKPTDPTRDGYEFLGWYIDEEGTTEWNFDDTMPHNDLTLYAKWNALEVPYSVWHIKMGTDGKYPEIKSNAECEDSSLCELETSTAITDSSVEPDSNDYGVGFKTASTISQTIKGDGTTVFEYKYERNKFKLDIVQGTGVRSINSVNGETYSSSKTYEFYYDEEVVVNVTAISAGYHINAAGAIVTSGDVKYTMPAEDSTLSITAEGHKITVAYHNYDGGNTVKSKLYYYGDDIQLEEQDYTKDVTLTIHNYDGKDGDTTVSGVTNEFLGWSSHKYDENGYTVEFTKDLNSFVPGSCLTKDIYAVYGIKLADLKSKLDETTSGLTFVGFSLDAEGTKMIDTYNDGTTDFIIDNNTQIYAIWDEQYSVRHVLMDTEGNYPSITNDEACTSSNLCVLETLKARQKSEVTPSVLTEITETIDGRTYKTTADVAGTKGFKAPSTITKTLDGKGESFVEYKYERKQYTLTILKGDYVSTITGQTEGSQQVSEDDKQGIKYTSYYGKVVTIKATSSTADGYYHPINEAGSFKNDGDALTFVIPDHDYTRTLETKGHTITINYLNYDGTSPIAVENNSANNKFTYAGDKSGYTHSLNTPTNKTVSLNVTIHNYDGNGNDATTSVSVNTNFLNWKVTSSGATSGGTVTVTKNGSEIEFKNAHPTSCTTIKLQAEYGISNSDLYSALKNALTKENATKFTIGSNSENELQNDNGNYIINSNSIEVWAHFNS